MVEGETRTRAKQREAPPPRSCPWCRREAGGEFQLGFDSDAVVRMANHQGEVERGIGLSVQPHHLTTGKELLGVPVAERLVQPTSTVAASRRGLAL